MSSIKKEITLANTGKTGTLGILNTTFSSSKNSLHKLCKFINQSRLDKVLNGVDGLTKELDTCLIAKILKSGELIDKAPNDTDPLYKYRGLVIRDNSTSLQYRINYAAYSQLLAGKAIGEIEPWPGTNLKQEALNNIGKQNPTARANAAAALAALQTAKQEHDGNPSNQTLKDALDAAIKTAQEALKRDPNNQTLKDALEAARPGSSILQGQSAATRTGGGAKSNKTTKKPTKKPTKKTAKK